MSYETRRKQRKANIAAIFKETFSEITGRTNDRLTQFQEQGEYHSAIVPGDEFLPNGEDLVLVGGESENAIEQMAVDTAIDIGVSATKGTLRFFKELVDNLFDQVETKPIYFGDFLRHMEEYFDAYILAYCKQENVIFVGGKLRIELTSEDVLPLTANLLLLYT